MSPPIVDPPFVDARRARPGPADDAAPGRTRRGHRRRRRARRSRACGCCSPIPTAAGEAFFARHGFVPINHMVVVKTELAEQPGVARRTVPAVRAVQGRARRRRRATARRSAARRSRASVRLAADYAFAPGPDAAAAGRRRDLAAIRRQRRGLSAQGRRCMKAVSDFGVWRSPRVWRRRAAEDVTIGMILPMTGPSASTGKQEKAGAELYIAQHGATVAGKTIKLVDQGRHRRRRRHQAPRAGTRRQRPRRRADGLRPDAAGARRRADRDRGESAGDRHRGGDRRHHREVALHRAHLVHAAAGLGADGGMGVKNGIKKVVTIVTDYGPGLDAREMVRRDLQEGRRRDRRGDPRAAEEPRFRAVPAARRRTTSPTRCSCSCPRASARSS